MKQKILIIALMVLVSLSLISALSIKDVESMPQEIMPGEIAEVSIEIENTLGMDVTNVNVKLDLSDVPFAPYQSSAERFIEEIEDEEDKTFNFRLIVLPTTDSGIYKIPVIISYHLEENETEQSKEELISLIVNSDVELKVFFEDTALIRGRENTFSIKIVNSGLSGIKFAYLTVSNVAGVKFISEKEQYIGDLDSDDFDSVEYSAYINPSAASSIKLPITLKYRDSTNKEFEEKQEVTLKIYSLKEAQELGFVKKPKYTIFLAIGIVISMYIVYRIRKKRKLKAKK